LFRLLQSLSDEDAAIAGMENDEYNLYEDLDLDTLAVGVGMFGADPNFRVKGEGEDDTDEAGGKSTGDDDSDASKATAKKATGTIQLGVANITNMIPGLAIGNSKTKTPAPAPAKATPVAKTAPVVKAAAPTAAAKPVPSAGVVPAKAADKKGVVTAAAKPNEGAHLMECD
jgi:hypothetical protein